MSYKDCVPSTYRGPAPSRPMLNPITKILSVRTRADGGLEYLVRRRGTGAGAYCEWEVEEVIALHGPDLLPEFALAEIRRMLKNTANEGLGMQKKISRKRGCPVGEMEAKRQAIWKKYAGGLAKARINRECERAGFELISGSGLGLEQIIGTATLLGYTQMFHWMKWQNLTSTDHVYGPVARARCLELVRDYLDEIRGRDSDSDSDESEN